MEKPKEEERLCGCKLKTKLETMIELEDTVRAVVMARFPSLNPDWAVNRYLDLIYDNSRKTAQAVVPMMAEVIRSQRIKGDENEPNTGI